MTQKPQDSAAFVTLEAVLRGTQFHKRERARRQRIAKIGNMLGMWAALGWGGHITYLLTGDDASLWMWALYGLAACIIIADVWIFRRLSKPDMVDVGRRKA